MSTVVEIEEELRGMEDFVRKAHEDLPYNDHCTIPAPKEQTRRELATLGFGIAPPDGASVPRLPYPGLVVREDIPFHRLRGSLRVETSHVAQSTVGGEAQLRARIRQEAEDTTSVALQAITMPLPSAAVVMFPLTHQGLPSSCHGMLARCHQNLTSPRSG